MKNFKTKIFSLIICMCLCLSFFSGCSLVTKKDVVNTPETALVIGETKVTKQDLVNSYYSFYNNNYYMLYSADEETILEAFYQTVVAREVALVEANKLLGTKIIFTEEDVNEIWNDVYVYIYDQVDVKEKNLLLEIDSDEEKLPERLQTEDEEDKEEVFKYEKYEFEPIVPKNYTEDNKDLKANYDAKIEEFKANLYKVNEAEEDEEPVWGEVIADEEKAVRKTAYEMYLADLILSAKAKGSSADKDSVLEAEIDRVLESYYESKLYTKYKEYIESTITSEEVKETVGDSGEGYFANKTIADKYAKILNASIESNTLRDNYVSVVTKSGNETLLLYHYEDKYVYFTVNHILVSWDEETLEVLKNTDGYSTSSDLLFRNYYEQVRAHYYTENMANGKLNTSYRDEDGKTVKVDGVKQTKTVGEIVAEYNTELAIRLDGVTDEAEKSRIRTILFNELAWKYSGDTGSLDSQFGFTVTTEADNKNGFVKDFAESAKAMFASYLAGTYEIGEEIRYDESVVSDFGVHIMQLTGVYEAGEVVSLFKDGGVAKTDAEIVADLQKAYVNAYSTQTLYEYVHDMVKEEKLENFFSNHINELVDEYDKAGLIEYVSKLTYEQLSAVVK